MKIKPFVIILIVLSTFILHQLFSQDEGEKELMENPELIILKQQAYAKDRYNQLEALEGIESFLNELRSVDSEDNTILQPIDPTVIPPQIEEMLIHLGSQGSLIINKKGNTIINDFPQVRKKACELLGWVRTENSKNFLLKFLKEDNEYMVKSEAAWALGEYAKYEGDKDGKIVQSLTFTIENESEIIPDNNLAYAVILSLGKIAENSDGLFAYATGYKALIKIWTSKYYIETVRNKAYEIFTKYYVSQLTILPKELIPKNWEVNPEGEIIISEIKGKYILKTIINGKKVYTTIQKKD